MEFDIHIVQCNSVKQLNNLIKKKKEVKNMKNKNKKLFKNTLYSSY